MKPIGSFLGDEQPRRTDNPDAGGIMTKHGWFSYGDLGSADGRLSSDVHGRRVVQFPVAYEQGGRPIYRAIPEHVLADGE